MIDCFNIRYRHKAAPQLPIPRRSQLITVRRRRWDWRCDTLQSQYFFLLVRRIGIFNIKFQVQKSDKKNIFKTAACYISEAHCYFISPVLSFFLILLCENIREVCTQVDDDMTHRKQQKNLTRSYCLAYVF